MLIISIIEYNNIDRYPLLIPHFWSNSWMNQPFWDFIAFRYAIVAHFTYQNVYLPSNN